jgi:hypothetical protein
MTTKDINSHDRHVIEAIPDLDAADVARLATGLGLLRALTSCLPRDVDPSEEPATVLTIEPWTRCHV